MPSPSGEGNAKGVPVFLSLQKGEYYPFDMQNLTPRLIEELEYILDFYRDINSVEVKVPKGMKVFDIMGALTKIKDDMLTVDIYPKYLVVRHEQVKNFLLELKARQILALLATKSKSSADIQSP